MFNASRPVPFLTSERLLLERVQDFHCTPTYLGWLHDERVNAYLESGRYPSTIEDLRAFVRGVQERESLFLAIVLRDGERHIGNIKIDTVNRMNGTAEYGILIGAPEEWGKGYGGEATELVLQHCFQKLNLRKITLGVLAENAGAVALYRRLGFVEEGLLKRHVFQNGAYRDIVRMAIFSPLDHA